MNASQIQEDVPHEAKWIFQVACMYVLNPCAVGAAIREEIWKHATLAGDDPQRPGSLIPKSFCLKQRFFALPHCCCCCCCAVAQDRRALLNAFKVKDKIEIYKPSFTATKETKEVTISNKYSTGNAKS